jgi:hypothetical protein
MNLTFEDLYFHQDILKTLLKKAEPNLYVCFITENYCNHTIFLDNGQAINRLGFIVLGIRQGPGSLTSIQSASIYNNGLIHNTYMPEALLYYTQKWILLIEGTEKRYNRRINTIKDELTAVVWHPDNIKRLLNIGW